jgi:hypothetical protein
MNLVKSPAQIDNLERSRISHGSHFRKTKYHQKKTKDYLGCVVPLARRFAPRGPRVFLWI